MTAENKIDDQENDGKALPFNETFQEAVIGHCLVDSRFFLRCKDRLKGSWFTKGARLGIIFDQLVKGYKKYNKPIQGISELLNEPFFLQLPPEELGRYQWTLDRCLFSKDAQGGFDQEKVRKKLTGFLRVNLFKEAIEGAAQAYKTKGLEDAYEWAQFKLKELQDASFEEDQMTLSFGDAYHWLQADLEDASKGISTGSKILDMALGGGLFKGETTAILAASNSGKTSLMFTVARHAVMQGKKVLLVTHEDSPKKLRKKFLSAFMAVNRNDLNSVGVHQDKKLVRLHLELVSKFLEDHFVYLPYNRVGQMYVEDVCTEIRRRHEDMKLRTGKGFDIVLDDYPQKLKLRKRGGDDQKRTELAEVYDYFNQLQIELDVHAFLAIQTNREGLKQNMGKLEAKENLGMDVVGESYGIAQNMGNIITLNRGPEDKKLHTVRLSVAKSRNDLTEVTVNTRTNYGCSLTHGDPEMFDFRKVYQKSLKHMVLSKKGTGGQQVLTADDVRVINKNVDKIISDSPLKPKVLWLPSYGQIDNQVKQASSIDSMLKGIESGEVTNEEQSETKSHQWALKTFAINLHQLQGSAATQDDLKRAAEPIETIEEPL